MKIENNVRTNLLHKGIIESTQKEMKQLNSKVEFDKQLDSGKKIFENQNPSSLKGFKIDKLA